jgi:excisionase family DNA binding protein
MDPLLTTEEVADYLRVDIVTVRRLVNRGDLTAYRIGSEYRFIRADLEDFVKQQRVSVGKKPGKDAYKNFTDWTSRFNEQARKALALAQQEARQLKHNYIGTEHILLGLVGEGEDIAGQVLTSFGVELNRTRSEIVSILKRGQERSPVISKVKSFVIQAEGAVEGEISLTRRAKKVIELASDEARLLGHQFIGTGHMLLAIIREGDGLAVGVLESLGVDLEKLRAKTLQMLNNLQSETSPEDAKPPLQEHGQTITCSRCGALNAETSNFCNRCGYQLK